MPIEPPITPEEQSRICELLGYSEYTVAFWQPSESPIAHALATINLSDTSLIKIRKYMAEIDKYEEMLSCNDDMYVAQSLEMQELQLTPLKARHVFRSEIKQRIKRMSTLMYVPINGKYLS